MKANILSLAIYHQISGNTTDAKPYHIYETGHSTFAAVLRLDSQNEQLDKEEGTSGHDQYCDKAPQGSS